jgi:polyvinyl alcohol dehydrogenase (cytochrome)
LPDGPIRAIFFVELNVAKVSFNLPVLIAHLKIFLFRKGATMKTFIYSKLGLRLLPLAILPILLISFLTGAQADELSWTMSGQNLYNTRHQEQEVSLGAANVGGLVPQWVFTTGSDVSATPAVAEGAVYFPDWAGNLYKLDAATGAVIWQKSIADYTGLADSVSRTTPTLEDNTLYVATQAGAYLLSIDKDSGTLNWKTQLDAHPAAILTQSPVVFRGVVYIGVASREEAFAVDPSYPCCTFRGSMTAVNAATGQLVWKTFMTLDNGGAPGGYSGAAVWGSTPVVDQKRNSVYITTGNNYDVPQEVKDCVANQDPTDPTPCDAPNNYIDAILALDLNTGAIKWANKLQGYDAWTVACFQGTHPNCPDPAGPDYDFGQGVMFFKARIDGRKRDLIGAGQKSGVFWALNPDDGSVVWATIGGPGGTLGGMEWGSATDGERIYYAIGNNGSTPYTLIDGTTTTAGLWGALDPATGAILWQTADPNGAIDTGAVSVANGVVYAGSMGGEGAAATSVPTFFALDATTGEIRWDFVSGGSVNAGATIVDGVVYWGSGYVRVGGGAGNNQFYAFGLP